jgi:RimJ/RimL family protein N-acetyltransferase
VATLIIRPSRQKDAERIVAYTKKVAGESKNLSFDAADFHRTVKEQKALIATSETEASTMILVGWVGDEVVSIFTFVRGSRPRNKHFGEMGITVQSAFQRRGIGRQMITEGLQRCRQLKISKVNLKVRQDHLGAIKLYESLGFKKEGLITKYFYIDGQYQDVYIMGKELI